MILSPFRLTLKPEWLPGLANLASLPPGILSAWPDGRGALLPQEAVDLLIEESALQPSGSPTPVFLAALDLLAAPAANVRLDFSGDSKSFTYRIFFSGLEGESVSLMENEAETIITAPARPADLLAILRQYTGESLIQSSALAADLPINEALALAALLDKRRRSLLLTLAAGVGTETPALTPGAAAEQIAAETTTPQWLTAAFRQAAGVETPPDSDHLAAALHSLANRGLAAAFAGGESFILAETPARLAERLLVVVNTVQLAAARANPEGDVNRAFILILQDGINDLLLIEPHAGLIHLESISAAGLLDLVEHYLIHPDALPLPPPHPVVWKLEISTPGALNQVFDLSNDLKIGRGSDCEVQIADPRASRHHALIRLMDGGFILSDLGSTNGTYVNHVQIQGAVRLQDGDLIRIGETTLRVSTGRMTGDTTPSVRSPAAEPLPVETPAPAEPQAEVEPIPEGPVVEVVPSAEPASEPEAEPVEEAPAGGYEPPAWLQAAENSNLPEAESLPVEPKAEEAPEVEPEAPAIAEEPLAWLHAAAEPALPESPQPQTAEAVEPTPAVETVEHQPEPEAEMAEESAGLAETAAGDEQPILGETRAIATEPAEAPILGETRATAVEPPAAGRTPTQQYCSRCGNVSPMEARFCGVCGNRLRD